ncbi:hypothetical protein ENSA5_57210 [Enhygromyxa salina]|uniref:Uncharacterized protein n=2 Tax=Enhygromyxa salina TaxID=215803 RepID=A0A2S9XEE7_9BACT|nr:hypothetical protein ENSA5_57210 [Enhygromyxa salina]
MMRRRNARVIEQLLGELEAKRYDSALVERILAAPGAFPQLLRACFLAQDRELDAARADVDRALECGGGNPVVAFAAGLILYTTGDEQRALDQLARAAELSPNAAKQARKHGAAMASEQADAHGHDRERLEQAKRMLLKALAHYTGPKPV